MTRDTEVATLARGGAINLVGAVTTAGATFAFFVLAARTLSPSAVGSVSVAIGVFTIATTLSQLGANTGLIRSVAGALALGRPERVRTLLRVGLIPPLIVSVVIAAAVWWASPWLAVVFADSATGASATGATAAAVRAVAPWIPFGTATLVLAATTQGFGTMVPAVTADRVGRSLLQVVTLAVVAGTGVTAAASAYAWPYAVAAVLLAVWVHHLTRTIGGGPGSVAGDRRLQVTPDPDVARTFWRFSAPRGVAAACQTSILWADTLLLAALASPAAAGTYAVATRFLVVGHLVIGAVLQALGPRLAALLTTNDQPRTLDAYRTATRAIVALVWPVYLVVALYAPVLLRIFGPEYVSAAPTLAILAVAMLVAAACGPVDVVLLMGGRSLWSLVNWSIALVVMIALDLVLIPRYGLEGAALAWAASILVRNLGPLVLVRRILHLDPFGAGSFRVAAICLAVVGGGGALSRWLLGPSWAGLITTSVVGGGLYLAALWHSRDALVSRTAETATGYAPEHRDPPTVVSR